MSTRTWMPLLTLLACASAAAGDMSARERIRASLVKPQAPSNLPIAQQRNEWEEIVSTATLPVGVEWRPIDAHVPAELITPPTPTDGRLIVYLHGGGFTTGSPRTHRLLGAYIAQKARSEVLLVDYRLAPEHKFPAARDDAVAAYELALARQQRSKRLFLAGDSAGGHVAVSALLEIRRRKLPMPAGVVLLSPWLDLAQRGETMRTRLPAEPTVLEEDLAQCAQMYLGTLSPLDTSVDLLGATVAGLPPIYIDVGDDEILLADSTRFAERVRAAGGEVDLEIWEGLWHVFHAWAPELPEANAAIERIGKYILRVAP